MKEFFKPTKFNLIFTAVLIAVLIMADNYIISPYDIGRWGWRVLEVIFSPLRLFHDLGLGILVAVNPGIKESSESIAFELGVIKYLIAWPLTIIYFYFLGTLVQKIIRKLTSLIR